MGMMLSLALCFMICVAHAFVPSTPFVTMGGVSWRAASNTSPILRSTERSFPRPTPGSLLRPAPARCPGFVSVRSTVSGIVGEVLESPRQAHRSVFENEVELLAQDGIDKLVIKSGDEEDHVALSWAAFGGSGPFSGNLVRVKPLTANGTIENVDELEGKIAVASRGANSFVEKAMLVQEAKAIALIIINSDDELITPGNAVGHDAIKIPVVLIGDRDGQRLMSNSTEMMHVSCGARPKDSARRLVRFGGFVPTCNEPAVLYQTSLPLLPGESKTLRVDESVLKSGQATHVITAFNPQPQRLPGVFCVATVSNVTSLGNGRMEAVFEGQYRVSVSAKSGGYDGVRSEDEALVMERLHDADAEDDEVAVEQRKVVDLLEKVVERIEQVHTPEAGPRFDGKLLDKAMSTQDGSLFSFLCCTLLPLTQRQRQLALQSTNTRSRLMALRFLLQKTLTRYEETALRRSMPGRLQPSFISEAVRKALPGTVQILPIGLRNSTSKGTGFIISNDGLVVTNAHVASLSLRLRVLLNDGRELQGKAIGRDSDYDIALVRLEGSHEELPTVTLGDSDDLRLGDWGIAIGNPSDCDNVVTQGIVSGFKRADSDPCLVDRAVHYILTDALYSRGMSGGPLLNAAGEVIGMNTFYRGDMNGMGFAIAVNLIKDKIADMIEESKRDATAMCKIVLYNDRFNTRERVARVLREIGLSNSEAERCMMEAHRNGRSTLGVWAREEAEELAQKLGAGDLLVEVQSSPKAAD